MEIPFVKLQGAGNGYLVVDGRELDVDWPALARAICDPHFGVGSDGLAVVAESRRAPLRMRIFNSDGSESEMSGNGIRLFAKHVLDEGLAKPEQGLLHIETGGGLRTVEPRMGAAGMTSAQVSMGEPCFEAARIPVDPRVAGEDGRVFDHLLDLGPRKVPITCLSIGNPHAVAILDEPVEDFPLAELGPRVVEHPLFPKRINFEIVNPLDRGRIRARIFERGEGETLASGTGSTACVIAARLHGLVDDAVLVVLRGGELHVRWTGAGEALLEGPAERVFRGAFDFRG